MLSRVLLSVLVLWLAACGDLKPQPAASIQARQNGLTDAERRTIFEEGRVDAERNSKLTPRVRRFHGDSLQP